MRNHHAIMGMSQSGNINRIHACYSLVTTSISITWLTPSDNYVGFLLDFSQIVYMQLLRS